MAEEEIITSGVTEELVGLGGPNGHEDPDIIGSDAWKKEAAAGNQEMTDQVPEGDSVFDTFRRLEENKPGNEEESRFLQENLEVGGPPEKPFADDVTEAPRQRTVLTRDQAVNLLKRAARADDALLGGMKEEAILDWAKRIQPMWQESQKNFQRVNALDNETSEPRAGDQPAPDDEVDVFQSTIEHSEEAASGEPDAQPSSVGVNFDELERELTDELGDTGKKLVATLKTVTAENQSLRQQVSKTANAQEQRDVIAEFQQLARTTYPQLGNNKQLQREVYQRAKKLVNTGDYSAYGPLLADAALLVLGAPQGGAGSESGGRDLDPRDRGSASVPTTRSAGADSTHSMNPDDRAYDRFQKLEAQKLRNETLGIVSL